MDNGESETKGVVLSSKEMSIISSNADQVKLVEKDKQILELKKQMLNVQGALLDAQKEVIKRDGMILEYHGIKIDQELKEAKEISKFELIEISKQYKDLEGKKWGYKPETGEIIINEEPETTP